MKPVEFRHLRTFGISFRNLEELRILRFQSKSRTNNQIVRLQINDGIFEGIRPPPNDFYDFSGFKNLKLLHICAWNQRDQDILTELLEQLLSASSQIKDLKIPFRPLNARNLLESIIHHCPSLTKLTLLSPDLKDEDCHLFASLPQLEHLIITGYYHSLTSDGKETILRSCPRMNPKNLIFTHEREISIMISSNTGSIRDFGLGFHFQEL
ncbi:uncharacterized protein LOC141854252 [Brevipalpus obovatus]|uniref:uncharacterized protein LOC141854252 n=1 Tax=Brevipalpus obovatus TaxID=246614 RepID=UPI003D9F873A